MKPGQIQDIQKARLLSAYGVNPQSQDLIEKGGKRAQIGEVREWNGQKVVKHQDGWVLLNEKTGKHQLIGPGGRSNTSSAEKHHIEHTKYHLEIHGKANNGEKKDSGESFPYDEHINELKTKHNLSDKDVNKLYDGVEMTYGASATKENVQNEFNDLVASGNITLKKKEYSFREILADPEGKSIIEAIEHGSSDPEIMKDLKKQLKDKFGYDYRGEEEEVEVKPAPVTMKVVEDNRPNRVNQHGNVVAPSSKPITEALSKVLSNAGLGGDWELEIEDRSHFGSESGVKYHLNRGKDNISLRFSYRAPSQWGRKNCIEADFNLEGKKKSIDYTTHEGYSDSKTDPDNIKAVQRIKDISGGGYNSIEHQQKLFEAMLKEFQNKTK